MCVREREQGEEQRENGRERELKNIWMKSSDPDSDVSFRKIHSAKNSSQIRQMSIGLSNQGNTNNTNIAASGGFGK